MSTQPTLEGEVDAILSEFFPDGLPLSRTKAARFAGAAEVVSASKVEKPLIDLTQEKPPPSGEFLSFIAA